MYRHSRRWVFVSQESYSHSRQSASSIRILLRSSRYFHTFISPWTPASCAMAEIPFLNHLTSLALRATRLGRKGRRRSRTVQKSALGLGIERMRSSCLSVKVRLGSGASKDRWLRFGAHINRFSGEGRSLVGQDLSVNNNNELRVLPCASINSLANEAGYGISP